jgi:hypothetical protein
MVTEGIMSTGDADELALTPEPTLEPELAICDAHHHLWEFRPEPVPYQRYLLPELAEDLGSGHNVRATVFIEVKARYRPDGPEDMRPVSTSRLTERGSHVLVHSAASFSTPRTDGRASRRRRRGRASALPPLQPPEADGPNTGKL